MAQRNYVEEYRIAKKKCDSKIAIVRSFLKGFGEKRDLGTSFYEDITVMSGLGGNAYNYLAQKHPDVFERLNKGTVSVFRIKASATFVIEYSKKFFDENKLWLGGKMVPENAFIIYDDWQEQPGKKAMVNMCREEPVSMDVALAVKELFWNQQQCAAVYGAHKQTIDYARSNSLKERY